MLKKWFRRNKTLLIIFVIFSVLLAILTTIQTSVLLDNLDDLDYYIETRVITKNMYTYAIIACSNLLIGVLWAVLLATLLLKMLFPNKETVKNAFCLNELEFLVNIPYSMKKGLSRKHEQQ